MPQVIATPDSADEVVVSIRSCLRVSSCQICNSHLRHIEAHILVIGEILRQLQRARVHIVAGGLMSLLCIINDVIGAVKLATERLRDGSVRHGTSLVRRFVLRSLFTNKIDIHKELAGLRPDVESITSIARATCMILKNGAGHESPPVLEEASDVDSTSGHQRGMSGDGEHMLRRLSSVQSAHLPADKLIVDINDSKRLLHAVAKISGLLGAQQFWYLRRVTHRRLRRIIHAVHAASTHSLAYTSTFKRLVVFCLMHPFYVLFPSLADKRVERLFHSVHDMGLQANYGTPYPIAVPTDSPDNVAPITSRDTYYVQMAKAVFALHEMPMLRKVEALTYSPVRVHQKIIVSGTVRGRHHKNVPEDGQQDPQARILSCTDCKECGGVEYDVAYDCVGVSPPSSPRAARHHGHLHSSTHKEGQQKENIVEFTRRVHVTCRMISAIPVPPRVKDLRSHLCTPSPQPSASSGSPMPVSVRPSPRRRSLADVFSNFVPHNMHHIFHSHKGPEKKSVHWSSLPGMAVKSAKTASKISAKAGKGFVSSLIAGVGRFMSFLPVLSAVETIGPSVAATARERSRSVVGLQIPGVSVDGPNSGSLTYSRTMQRNPEEGLPVVLHMHGGGFLAHTSDSHQAYLRLWANATGAIILSIDYTLLPYPTALLECFMVYKWLIDGHLGFHPSQLILAGDSAGGNLATATCMMAMSEGLRVPDGMFLFYPAMYLFNAPSPSRLMFSNDPIIPRVLLSACVKAYLPNVNLDRTDVPTDPFVSPGLAPDHILREFPPTRINVGTFDPLLDDSMDFSRRLVSLGVDAQVHVHEAIPHGYLNLGYLLPETAQIIDHSCAILNDLFRTIRDKQILASKNFAADLEQDALL